MDLGDVEFVIVFFQEEVRDHECLHSANVYAATMWSYGQRIIGHG